ncbi:MAG: replicative DNA helicase [Planctomycetia bacterium]|nr:replicative DNA helicase [Planctomycetia bacterium]
MSKDFESSVPRRSKKNKEASSLSSLDRMPPCNLEAERGVIGSLILDSMLCDDVATTLRAEDFYSEANKRIYRLLLEMHNSSTGIDLMLLVERLKERGELDEIGGEAYLAELMSSVQISAHAVLYAKIVRDQAIRRDLIRTSTDILLNAYDPQKSPRDLVSQAEENIFAIGDSRNTNQLSNMNDVILSVYDLLDKKTTGDVDGVPTGFFDLDKMLGGLHGSELIILAARPSMGKTAFATNIAENVAVAYRIPVLFFSLEMAKIELAIRMISARGKVKNESIRGNFLDEKDKKRFHKAASELSNSPFYIDDTPSRTVTEIGAVARRLKRQEDLGLIIIDYLGLIEPDNANDPRQEQVAKIARRLKGLARELNIPVLCLSQLNRMAEATKDNRPRLSHLRESGAIEQDADVVMFVHREEYYHSKDVVEDKGLGGLAEIIVAKQRNGPVGEIKLYWRGEFTLFANYYNEKQSEHSEFNPFGNEGFENDSIDDF